jgi:hypothetical protein
MQEGVAGIAVNHEPWEEFAIYELANQEEDTLPEDELDDPDGDDPLDKTLDDMDSSV